MAGKFALVFTEDPSAVDVFGLKEMPGVGREQFVAGGICTVKKPSWQKACQGEILRVGKLSTRGVSWMCFVTSNLLTPYVGPTSTAPSRRVSHLLHEWQNFANQFIVMGTTVVLSFFGVLFGWSNLVNLLFLACNICWVLISFLWQSNGWSLNLCSGHSRDTYK